MHAPTLSCAYMNTTIEHMGEDLVVCIPPEIAARFGLHAGSDVVVVEEVDAIRIELVKNEPCNTKSFEDWEKGIPSSGKTQKENLSENVDQIVYGASRNDETSTPRL